MANIIVRRNGKYKLWNTVVDQWATKLITKESMITYLINEIEIDGDEAAEWVDRKNQSKEHLRWLKRFFDSQYESLCRIDRKNKAEWKCK